MLRCLLLAQLVALAGLAPAVADDVLFEKHVRPVLVATCFKCHGGEKTNGKLRVDSREALVKGGETGPAIVPGDPEHSLLMQALRRGDDVSAMPPDKKLPAETIDAFASWIKSGAPWPDNAAAKTAFAYRRHWAFEPPKEPTVPVDAAAPSASAIDCFVNAKQRAQGVAPAVAASKRTLIRRATFDLLGLPPTPEEVAAFVADESPQAYAHLIERLLASPQYGERWGRHWLDVVRYADTAGETADFPVPHAWRYRQYVIEAFNRDMPYDQFLREQIAGDILAKQLPAAAPAERYAELVTATGYLAVARRFGFDPTKDHYLTLEDTIDTLGKSVLGLSLGCARCHSHKYDPITSDDYYALYGIFDSTRYPFPGSEKLQHSENMAPLVPPAEMERRMKPYRDELAALEAAEKAAAAARAPALEKSTQAFAAATLLAEGEFANGGAQEISAGGKTPLESIAVTAGQMLVLSVLPKTNHGADSTLVELEIAEVTGEKRTWNLAADTADDVLAANPHADRQGHAQTWCFLDFRGGPALFTQKVPKVDNRQGISGWGQNDTPLVGANSSGEAVKFITVTLGPRSFFVHPSPQAGVAVAWISPLSGTVRISGKLTDADASGGDGIAWKLSTAPPEAFSALMNVRNSAVAVDEARKRREAHAAKQPNLPLAYAVSEGEPHNVKVHKRGDPEQPGSEVSRRYLEMFGGDSVPPSGGSGRLALAGWLTSPQNPLTARVMVNRIWQHHFGTGLVATPNDFGTRGTPPTHPELLDYLALRFMESGWSVKAMHRLMLQSAAYQRAGSDVAETSQTADSVLLARFPLRRLSAEEIRDAMLAVSGDLDTTPAGPHPFPEESQWKYTQHAPFTAVYDTNRRSVYLMVQRLKRHPFLALFDGADPAASTPDRFTTTVPTQALFFLNDPFVHARAQSLAARLASAGDDGARLNRACEVLYSRPAAPAESVAFSAFLASYAPALPSGTPGERREQAWTAWCRVMLGSNEFLYVP